MKEWPILFQGAMVRAILAGIKTQTRRTLYVPTTNLKRACFDRRYAPPSSIMLPPPKVQAWTLSQWRKVKAGDRLWVRETWAPEQYDADATSMAQSEQSTRTPAYAADFAGNPAYKWRPSIHMPRAACRIHLEATADARVERLQSISEADALAEGIEPMRCPDCHLAGYGLPGWGHDQVNPTAPAAYRYLWDSINGERQPWADNPWTVALSFKQVEP